MQDNFALRQWDDPNYGGTKIVFDKREFIDRVQQAHDSGAGLVDGYAPFCKHVFVPSFVGAKVGALEITDDNRPLLQSGYTKRRPEELAVLTRWFSASDLTQGIPDAKYLDIILYSREQLVKEYADMPTKDGAGTELPDAPWGIISVKVRHCIATTPRSARPHGCVQAAFHLSQKLLWTCVRPCTVFPIPMWPMGLCLHRRAWPRAQRPQD